MEIRILVKEISDSDRSVFLFDLVPAEPGCHGNGRIPLML